ncbi:MAG: hypothetical protein ACYTGP_09235 [Planctomycetota bacterium]|jgi:hypothetical protein
MSTKKLLFIAAACLGMSAGVEQATAGFTGMSIQDVSDSVGAPAGLKTLRVFANFDDPTDRVFGVGAEPALGGISFTTTDPDGLRNEGQGADFPMQPLVADWDSYVTIGDDANFFNQILDWAGAAGSIEGTSFGWTDGGWYRNDFVTGGIAGPSVLVAQFTIGVGFDFEFSGLVQWRDVNHPAFASSGFTVSSFGIVTSGACCLTPTLCIVTTEEPCAGLGGQFLGVGVECATQVLDVPCHPGDTAVHCVAVLLTCPEEGGDSQDGPGCGPGPLIDPWESETPVEPGDPTSFHDFGEAGQAIPADFFGPGSDPFTDVVPLVSKPLGVVDLTPYGGDVIDVGNTDTLILRSEDPFDRCELPGPTEVPVDIEIIALSLQGHDPIVVSFNGGQNLELWTIEVTLSDVAPPPGGLGAVKTHCTGGAYEVFDLPVQPKFTFTKVDEPGTVEVFDTGLEGIPAVQLTLVDGKWVSDVGENVTVLSPYCTDFHPGLHEEFPVTDCDCNTNGQRDRCDIEQGISGDCNFNGVPDECEFPPCPEDLNGNLCVDFADILRVISVWGPCPGCPEDLNGNDSADFADILVIIGAWGPCTGP